MDKEIYKKLISSSCGNAKKRLFIGLLILTSLLLSVFIFIFLIIPWINNNYVYFKIASLTVGIIFILLIGFFCVNSVISLYLPNYIFDYKRLRLILIRFLLPLMESLCSFLKINKSDIRRSFIKINNEYVLQHLNININSKILLLLPHCVQNNQCEIRLTPDIQNCRNCGKCLIGITKEISLKKNIYTIIASGGTIARKYVKEINPDFIIAIACERDLTSGIQDCFPIPVFGIMNIRNFGPCVNTTYSLPLLNLLLASI